MADNDFTDNWWPSNVFLLHLGARCERVYSSIFVGDRGASQPEALKDDPAGGGGATPDGR